MAGKVGGGLQVALDTGEVLASTMDFKAEADLELKSGGKANPSLVNEILVRLLERAT